MSFPLPSLSVDGCGCPIRFAAAELTIGASGDDCNYSSGGRSMLVHWYGPSHPNQSGAGKSSPAPNYRLLPRERITDPVRSYAVN